MECEYILLLYCPDILSSSGRRIGLVYRYLGSSTDSSMHLEMHAGWEHGICKRDLSYIHDVVDDLRSLDDTISTQAFEGISEAATGVLRVEKSGFCSKQETATLLLQPRVM